MAQRLTKNETAQMNEFLKDKNEMILMMAVCHYINIGENSWTHITQKDLDATKEKVAKEEKEAEQRGAVRIISAELTAQINQICFDLARLPKNIRYRIIKQYL